MSCPTVGLFAAVAVIPVALLDDAGRTQQLIRILRAAAIVDGGVAPAPSETVAVAPATVASPDSTSSQSPVGSVECARLFNLSGASRLADHDSLSSSPPSGGRPFSGRRGGACLPRRRVPASTSAGPSRSSRAVATADPPASPGPVCAMPAPSDHPALFRREPADLAESLGAPRLPGAPASCRRCTLKGSRRRPLPKAELACPKVSASTSSIPIHSNRFEVLAPECFDLAVDDSPRQGCAALVSDGCPRERAAPASPGDFPASAGCCEISEEVASSPAMAPLVVLVAAPAPVLAASAVNNRSTREAKNNAEDNDKNKFVDTGTGANLSGSADVPLSVGSRVIVIDPGGEWDSRAGCVVGFDSDSDPRISFGSHGTVEFERRYIQLVSPPPGGARACVGGAAA